MYDRAPRFGKLVTATPENVGPATYILSDIFDRNLKCQCGPGSDAPFQSSSLRTISFTNKTQIENPSPNKYKICFRKIRIVGGTIMQNLSPRFNYREKDYIIGPDLTKEAKQLPGHIHRGVPPRNSATKVSSIPEKGAEGYLVTDDGLVKIYNPPQNRPVGPTTYYNPDGHENYTTLQYKGNFWSFRTAKRFRYKAEDGPSPAEYSVNQETVSPWQKYQDELQSLRKASAPSLRYNDVEERRLCREDLPGPGSYSPNDPNTKKCECGEGTFSKAERGSWQVISSGPGPAAYTDPRSGIEKATRYVSVSQSPFNVDAERFPDKHIQPLPGPADYVPIVGLWADVQRKGHSRYSQYSAPFDSSSFRNTSFTKSDVLCIPGPDIYYPEFQKKGDENKSSMFASKVERATSKTDKGIPGPGAYETVVPFKLMTNHKSHLHPKDSAFLTSSERMKPLTSQTPGPDTYDTVRSSLNSKSGVIGLRFKPREIDVTPGPPDYTVHPKYAVSRVLQTNNVTLGKQSKPKVKKWVGLNERRNPKEIVKRLRCFEAPYPTIHCASY